MTDKSDVHITEILLNISVHWYMLFVELQSLKIIPYESKPDQQTKMIWWWYLYEMKC